MIFSRKIDQILNRGLFLGDIGIKNWALNKAEALIVLSVFEAEQIPILGGDVYVASIGVISCNYDNWYYEKAEDESLSDYASNSIKVATEYIMSYPEGYNSTVFFVLVPDAGNMSD